MPNKIKNATGLDGVANWTGAGLTIDETVAGSPGRAVIKSTGASLASAAIALNGATVVYASAHHEHDRNLAIQWLDAGGAQVGQNLMPLIRFGDFRARRGIPSTFDFSRGAATAPGGATQYRLASIGAAGQLLLQPFASTDGFECWTPGPHDNPDLNLDVWPVTLPDLRELDSPRSPTRRSFDTDSGIPSGSRIATRGRILLTGEFRLSLEQLDTLEQFHEARNLLPESRPFWFVHPDTRRLCRAWFNPDDGDPSVSAGGRDRRVRVGLLLEVA